MKKAIIVLFSILMSGCVILPESYFSPTSEGGETVRSSCRKTVGPENSVEIKVENVLLTFSLSKTTNSHYQDQVLDKYKLSNLDSKVYAIRVDFNIPDNNKIVWHSDTLTIKSNNENIIDGHIFGITDHSVSGGNYILNKTKIGQELKGETSSRGTYKHHKHFSGYIWIGKDKFNWLSLEAFDLRLNGNLHTIPKITFTHDRGWYIYPLNC